MPIIVIENNYGIEDLKTEKILVFLKMLLPIQYLLLKLLSICLY